MIIFDLDALADDSHRRHYIDPNHILSGKGWKPDYGAYNAACEGDCLIKPVAEVYEDMRFQRGVQKGDFQIWSSQCESTKYKTYEWLHKNNLFFNTLKMRPIGDDSPQEELFEKWCNQYHLSLMPGIQPLSKDSPHESSYMKSPIEMIFSSHKPTTEMFRKRGVFVFDCNQEK